MFPSKQEIIEHFKESFRQGLSDSELSEAQRRQVQRNLDVFRFLPNRSLSSEDWIIPSALVRLRLVTSTGDGREALYLIVPSGGGLIASIKGCPVQVLTSDSPLGSALVGKKQGDSVKVTLESGIRNYEILSVE